MAYDHYPRATNAELGSTAYSQGLVGQTVTTLTNAQVLALRATPITLVAAPGAGYFLEFVSAAFVLNYGGTQYTESNDNLAVKYVNGSGSAASATVECTGFIDVAGDAITLGHPITTEPLITAAGELSNAVLCLHNTGDGEFGGGHASSTLKVFCNYRIHATAL